MSEREIQEIQEMIDSYNFTGKIFTHLVLVRSNFDSWVIEIKCNSIVLKHQNIRRNKTRKFQEHKQKSFQNGTILDALKEIQKHDTYTLKYKHNGHSRIWQKIKEISKT